MKVTVLVDNLRNGPLKGEWGLSFLIEYEKWKILLDTGASGLFARNARRLGIDLGEVDHAVLSHAHYDHSDGMSAFFRENDHASLYIREKAEEDCYSQKWLRKKYIGIKRGELKRYQDRIVRVAGDYELEEGVYLIPHKAAQLERAGLRAGMYRRTGRHWRPDDFSHEQSLVFETQKGLVIFNSCSHGGVEVIIREVMDTFPGQPIYAMLGGFHLFHKPEAEVRSLARKIHPTGVEKIYTGHCTGEKAFQILRQELGSQVRQWKTGMRISL